MPTFNVHITRHIITYRIATAYDIEAETHEDAAKIADGMSLEWTEDDTMDEGPVDYEVTSPTEHTSGWRDDG